jgi:hypothetical protein
LSRDTTIDDVVCVLNLLPDIIARLRALSPSEQDAAPAAANSSRSPELTL